MALTQVHTEQCCAKQEETATLTVIWARQLVNHQPKLEPVQSVPCGREEPAPTSSTRSRGLACGYTSELAMRIYQRVGERRGARGRLSYLGHVHKLTNSETTPCGDLPTCACTVLSCTCRGFIIVASDARAPHRLPRRLLSVHCPVWEEPP